MTAPAEHPGSSPRRYTTLSTDIHRMLRQQILTCKLAPGQMIYESELRVSFGVSKSPVREALKQLTQEELVQAIPSVGYVVTPITLADVREMCEMRRILESAAIDLAVERVTDSDVRRLGLLVGQAYQHADYSQLEESDRTRWYLTNTEFHVAIAEIAANRRLAQATRRAMEDMLRLYFVGPLSQASPQPLVTNHSAIIDALRRRDAVEAKELALEDVNRSLRSLEALLVSNRSPASVPGMGEPRPPGARR